MSAESTDTPAPGPQYYDLAHREDAPAMVWRYRDFGVTLTADALEWTTQGMKQRSALKEIAGIHLTFGNVPRSGDFGSCRITFRNGRFLIINSFDSWGTPASERAPVYRQFVRDLHARLAPEDRRRISFNAGHSTTRQTLGKVFLVLAGLLFVVLPIGLLLFTGELKGLFITVAGVGFVYPFYRAMKANEPRSYDPDDIPDELLP